ncbi:hypothetical protein, partial [Mesorhizobium sp.]|uniref:hypothetical protein n=1 Tax=Mesorhizobium sp. TaxID=1871066 RepID=UPI0025F1306F
QQTELAPPCKALTRGEIGSFGASLFLRRPRSAKAVVMADLPLAGEMAGQARGGRRPANASGIQAINTKFDHVDKTQAPFHSPGV